MVILDHEIPFTNILLEETIDNIINDLSLKTVKIYNFEKNDLKKLRKFASYDSFYVFDNDYYRQIHNVAVEFSLEPITASAFFMSLRKTIALHLSP